MSLPRYPKYKDSGVEWLGEVPEHWETVPLKYLASLKGRLGWQGLRADEYTPVGPYLVTSEHFNSGKIDWDRCYHVSPERYEMAPEIQLRPGDLLMMKDGAAMGKLAYVDDLPGPSCLNSHLLLFRPRDGRFENLFLFYLLGTPSFTAFVAGERTGTTFFGISQESIGNFPFAHPSVHEQQAILTFLSVEVSKLDALVEEQRRLIELLKEKRQAVISHAVTKGLNPHAPMKPSGIDWLGKVPTTWTKLPLKFACSVIKDGTHLPPPRTESGIPLLSVRNLIDGQFKLREDDSLISVDDYNALCRSFRPEEDDVLLAIVGATLGKTAVVPAELGRFQIQRSLAVFRTRRDVLSSRFLSYAFQSEPFQHFLWSQVGYSAQPGIYLETLANVSLALPNLEEQADIVSWLDDETARIDALISEAKGAIDLLQERRSALISAAVTGKIDVRGLASTEAA